MDLGNIFAGKKDSLSGEEAGKDKRSQQTDRDHSKIDNREIVYRYTQGAEGVNAEYKDDKDHGENKIGDARVRDNELDVYHDQYDRENKYRNEYERGDYRLPVGNDEKAGLRNNKSRVEKDICYQRYDDANADTGDRHGQ